jgi:hypothetical protein
VEDSRVSVIHRDRIHRLREDEDFRDDFLRNLLGKMRFLSQQLYVLATMDEEGLLTWKGKSITVSSQAWEEV